MIKFSILIVTRNRVKDLDVTLKTLEKTISGKDVEILVLSDGCLKTKDLLNTCYPLLKSFYLEKSIGASSARNFLYKRAKGSYLIGLDDDANFITDDYFIKIEDIFKNDKIGVIAFEEIKDLELGKNLKLNSESFYTNEFIGCGFCIRKKVYDQTRGFPTWMDIYGEEACVAIDVLDKGYEIFYTDAIVVHHRVDKSKRKSNNYDTFRFKKSLLNGNKYYLVYYPLLMLPKALTKIFIHNFRKYAVRDVHFFSGFFKSYINLIKDLIKVLKYRKPVSNSTIKLKQTLKPLRY